MMPFIWHGEGFVTCVGPERAAGQVGTATLDRPGQVSS